MQPSKLARHLEDLGFDEQEARIYMVLLQSGPSRAGEICNLTDASRGKVYNALKELCRRGVASKTVGTPAIYEAAEPGTLFDLAIQNLDRERSYVEMLQDQLLHRLEELQATGTSVSDPEWEVLEGQGAIFENLNPALMQAEHSIKSMSSHSLCGVSVRPVLEAWRILVEQAARGVDVELLTRMDAGVPERLAEVDPEGTIRARPLEIVPTLHFVLIDERLVYYWIVAARHEGIHRVDDVVIRTDAHGLVDACRLLQHTLWEQAAGKPEGGMDDGRWPRVPAEPEQANQADPTGG